MLLTSILWPFLAFISIGHSSNISSSCLTDTKWNQKLVGANLRYWISSIKELKESTEKAFKVHFKTNLRIARFKELEDRLDFVGRKDQNSPFWKAFGHKGPKYHDGFLYGPNLQMSGENVAFIYPDFETALFGLFKNGTMLKAKPVKILAERCKNGIKEVKFSKAKATDPSLKFQRPTKTRPGDQPLVIDPFERKMIYVADGIFEDGIFARKDIRSGELICYYSGIIYPQKDLRLFLSKNMTSEELEDAHRNMMSIKDGKNKYAIDVPRQYWNIANYRSSLGHKANHSFKNNADYHIANHPRFGLVRTVRAIEDIWKGEEIFVHYEYSVGSRVAKWYSDLYQQEMGKPWPKKHTKATK